jgi:hydroxyethylthiazole kinase-like uncharacterized protein yjeF
VRYLPTPKQMAAADEAAIAAGTPADVLMDRAGRAVARAVLDVMEHRYGLRVAIVCGKGNNGGDGFVAARALSRHGASVKVFAVGDVEADEGAAGAHLSRWKASGGRVEPFRSDALDGADVVVDALFGTGFHGSVQGEAARAIDAINACDAPVVAIDIPSGVDGTTGRCDGPCVSADLTVAMGAEKVGTAIGEGASRAGTVVVADIGIPVTEAVASMVDPLDVARILPTRADGAHKRSSGTVVVLAGSDAMTGAAVLTARAALRAGSGYVNLISTEAVRAPATETTPELVIQVAEGDVLGPGALDRAQGLMDRADSVAIGPGLGTGEPQRELVARVLAEIELPVVVDADALNVLAQDTSTLERRSAPLILTPHPAELARLLDLDTSQVQDDRLGTATEAARRFGCVVVSKGHRSVIAGPDGTVFVNPTGGPELATAGTGDVLTGVCGSYLAAGLDAQTAAWGAAYVHGAAGALAALDRGSSGVVAWDVAENLGDAADRIVEGSWF